MNPKPQSKPPLKERLAIVKLSITKWAFAIAAVKAVADLLKALLEQL